MIRPPEARDTQGAGRALLWRTAIGFICELLGLAVIVLASFPLLLVGVLLVSAGGYAILTGGGNIRHTMTLFALFAVMGAGAGALRQGLRYQEIEKHAIITKAVVLDTGRTGSGVRGGKRWIEYGYTVDGSSYRSRQHSLRHVPGDTIQIRYMPAEPSVSLPVEPGAGQGR